MEHGSTIRDHNSGESEAVALDPATTYDHVADIYEEMYDSRVCHAENKILASILRSILPLKGVVDIGRGTGLLLDMLGFGGGLEGHYFGFDPCEMMLAQLKERYPNAHVEVAHYGEVALPSDAALVGLFGVPNYIEPALLDVPRLKEYFLMFYRVGYRPTYYHPPRNEPYLGFEFDEYDLGDSYVTQFSDYMIVTDLL